MYFPNYGNFDAGYLSLTLSIYTCTFTLAISILGLLPASFSNL